MICGKYKSQLTNGLDYDDLYATALLAFSKCMAKWDPTRSKLITYCTAAVQNEIWHWLKLQRRHGFKGVGDSKEQKTFAAAPMQGSCKLPGDDNAELFDMLADKSGGEHVTWTREQWDSVFAVLNARQREVIRLRIIEGKTLSEIGDQVGVSKERVRQIETQAVLRIRKQADQIPDLGDYTEAD